MQENRSFDSYFGTYPGADGIPMQNGQPSVCVPDPLSGGCIRPYHDPQDLNHGGPRTDGRPDPRPDVRENAAQLGDLLRDFDFTQPLRPPLLLPVHAPQTAGRTGR